MKNKQFSQSTGLNWIQKTFIIIIAIIVIVTIFGVYLYQDIMKNKSANFEQTREVILEQTPITKVNKIELYHGDEAYHLVYGSDEKGEEQIIFYPLKGKEKDITTIGYSEIIPKDQILQTWQQNCANCELNKISPALIEDKLLWEITYYDENDRYVLDYLSIHDGSSYEQYRFKRMFD
ncbi:DUF5590 domain-containing protein [Oceanobacillus sp. Castelsardo]|uniref:cell wall elongation regulator TseB-like domain-containing protein n=1 Tax=Oceanobacillus sp. Castelsardo TaxID=1851204 RepID=UPI0009EEBD57|nr:DUF5590 domain-containing protein [Oceanobacillus sp. Castelsardo]